METWSKRQSHFTHTLVCPSDLFKTPYRSIIMIIHVSPHLGYWINRYMLYYNTSWTYHISIIVVFVSLYIFLWAFIDCNFFLQLTYIYAYDPLIKVIANCNITSRWMLSNCFLSIKVHLNMWTLSSVILSMKKQKIVTAI